MLKVFIGYDPKEKDAYDVLEYSIKRHASKELEIIPLNLTALRNSGIFTRENVGTTEFSMTRFLVPFLSNYEGVSIFMDCDMLCKTDLTPLFLVGSKTVYCVQHDYTPTPGKKAMGENVPYPRKNWSSFMVFNNSKCKALTLDYVNTASPADLHRMTWANEDIGALDAELNWLVGEYPHNDNALILHYTLGTPCFEEYKNCDHSEEWHNEYALLKSNS